MHKHDVSNNWHPSHVSLHLAWQWHPSCSDLFNILLVFTSSSSSQLFLTCQISSTIVNTVKVHIYIFWQRKKSDFVFQQHTPGMAIWLQLLVKTLTKLVINSMCCISWWKWGWHLVLVEQVSNISPTTHITKTATLTAQSNRPNYTDKAWSSYIT